MEWTLVIVTLVSLALAIAMGVITWRLLQEERLRADARVAALEQGLAASASGEFAAGEFAGGEIAGGPFAGEAGEDALGAGLAQFPSSAAVAATAPIADAAMGVAATGEAATEEAPSPAMSGTGNLFGQVETADEAAGLSRRAVAIAAVAAVMIGAVLGVWTIGRLMAPAVETKPPAAATAPAALELVALRHAQQDGTLTINGLVRNPRGGVPQERLTAVVFFFDGQGGFISSTRAPLDFRALAPGDESPFQIATPAPPGVARFRVSFRRDEGGIVPHVDRRQQDARQQEASRS